MVAACCSKPRRTDNRIAGRTKHFMSDQPQAKSAVHESVRPALDDFCERIDSHAATIAELVEHSLEHGKRGLRAVYEHDQAAFSDALGVYAKEVLHEVFSRIAPDSPVAELVEGIAQSYVEREAGKIWEQIAK